MNYNSRIFIVKLREYNEKYTMENKYTIRTNTEIPHRI